jgi:hypothetical protein
MSQINNFTSELLEDKNLKNLSNKINEKNNLSLNFLKTFNQIQYQNDDLYKKIDKKENNKNNFNKIFHIPKKHNKNVILIKNNLLASTNYNDNNNKNKSHSKTKKIISNKIFNNTSNDIYYNNSLTTQTNLNNKNNNTFTQQLFIPKTNKDFDINKYKIKNSKINIDILPYLNSNNNKTKRKLSENLYDSENRKKNNIFRLYTTYYDKLNNEKIDDIIDNCNTEIFSINTNKKIDDEKSYKNLKFKNSIQSINLKNNNKNKTSREKILFNNDLNEDENRLKIYKEDIEVCKTNIDNELNLLSNNNIINKRGISIDKLDEYFAYRGGKVIKETFGLKEDRDKQRNKEREKYIKILRENNKKNKKKIRKIMDINLRDNIKLKLNLENYLKKITNSN